MSTQSKLLNQQFERVAHYAPHLVHDATPLATGSYGLVVEHADHSLRKIIFRTPDNSALNASRNKEIANEIHALRILSSSAAAGFTPRLIEGPVNESIHSEIHSSYRMTKMEGVSPNWFNADITQSSQKGIYFESAGRLLGKFHMIAGDLPFNDSSYRGTAMAADKILPSELHSANVNARLERANAYLQEHKEAGVMHGDFHGGNIMTDENLRASGLIDFAFTGKTDNLYADMIFIPPYGDDDFIRGYNAETHKNIDKKLIHATRIAFESLRLQDAVDMGIGAFSGTMADDVERHLEAFENAPT